MSNFSPSYDNKIARKYSVRTIEHKMDNKTALQEEIGWVAEPKLPIICLPSGMTDALGGEIALKVIEGLLELPVGIVIRGRGSQKYGDTFTKLAKEHSYKIKLMPDTETGFRKLLAGSDIALFCSEPNEDLEHVLRYGVIPVALPSSNLENYNPVQESGNAFIYDKPTHWQCFASLVRAIETFKFPYDWRTIQRHAMESARETEEDEGKKD